MFYVYILKSSVTDKFYIGQTKDIAKRNNHHNSSKARWTKGYHPWKMVYNERCESRSDAMKRKNSLRI